MFVIVSRILGPLRFPTSVPLTPTPTPNQTSESTPARQE